MKTVALKLLVVLILASNVSFANVSGDSISTLEAVVIERKDNVIAVHVKKPEAEEIRIKITSISGDIIYSEFITSFEMAIKKYDLSKLPSGNYKVEVSGGKKTFAKYIQIQ